jgi:hypothetical protein
MIYMWFTGINYHKLAVEKDRDSILLRPFRSYGNQVLTTDLKENSFILINAISFKFSGRF